MVFSMVLNVTFNSIYGVVNGVKCHIQQYLWQQPMQSVPIITDVVGSTPAQGEEYKVIKFVSDLRHVGGFLWVLRFPPPIKLTVTI
jgi:hypothetical protein